MALKNYIQEQLTFFLIELTQFEKTGSIDNFSLFRWNI